MGLGLTGRQARVYLATLKLGVGKIQAIAELSLVSRQEIYRLIDDLQERGLIQKHMTNPTAFTATPIEQVAHLLLQQKTNQLNVISQQMEQLAKRLSFKSCFTPVVHLKPCFGTIFEADLGRKYCQTITGTKQHIEIVTSWRRFKQLNIHFEAQLQSALKKGVTLHIITEKPKSHHLPKWIKPALSKYPNFKLKTHQTQPVVSIAIFDQTTAAIAFDPTSSLTEGA